jgi:hypothetical protein
VSKEPKRSSGLNDLTAALVFLTALIEFLRALHP